MAEATGRPTANDGEAPRYEIVWSEPNKNAANWNAISGSLRPWLAAAKSLLGEAYVFAARLVIEQIETFEDRQAERKVRLRAAGKRALEKNRKVVSITQIER